MLRPNKHSHPDQTIINLSLLLLLRLKENRLENFSNLRNYAKNKVKGGDLLFMPSINLLFLLGKINYYPKTDAFEYISHNETI